MSAAVGIWLGFPNDLLAFPPLVLLWPLSLFLIGYNAQGWRNAMLTGLLGTFAGMAAALYWLCLPVAQVGGMPWPLAFLCALLIAFCLSTQGALFSCLCWFVAKTSPCLIPVITGLGWYLLEYIYALCLGVPWLPLSGALVQWPLLAQGANVTGAYLLGGIWTGCAIAILLGLLPGAGIFARLINICAGSAFIAALLLYGAGRMTEARLASDKQPEESIQAILVEGNIDQNQKWTLPFQKESLAIYLSITNEAVSANPQANLIIWPETSMPFFIEREHGYFAELETAVARWTKPLLFGAPGIGFNREKGREAIYNRAFLLDNNGELIGKYDKQHLVPFGEYVPPWLNLKFLEPLLQGVGIYDEGGDGSPLILENIALGTLICYEGIFPWLAQDRVRAGANLLVDISNDGWFGRTPAARQHLYLTALRCIEQGRWLLRATNTGISANIDPTGSIIAKGPVFQRGYLTFGAELIAVTTPFHRIYDWLGWTGAGIFGVLLVSAWMERKHGSQKARFNATL